MPVHLDHIIIFHGDHVFVPRLLYGCQLSFFQINLIFSHGKSNILLKPHVCGLLQNIFQLFSMRTSLRLDIFIFLELQVPTCTKDAKQANKSVFLRLLPTSFCFETAGLRVSHILSRWKSQSSKNKKEIFRLVKNFILRPKNM